MKNPTATKVWESEILRKFFCMAADVELNEKHAQNDQRLLEFFEDAFEASICADPEESAAFPISLYVVSRATAAIEEPSDLEKSHCEIAEIVSNNLHQVAISKLQMIARETEDPELVSRAVALLLQYGEPADLEGLDCVRKLDLSNQPFGRAQSKKLRNLSGLEELNLTGTFFSGQSLTFLEGMPNLQTLSLARTPIRSVDVAYLSPLKSLRQLDLSGTKIDDLAVAYLNAMPQLTEIALQKTLVLPEAAETLRSADCVVICD